MILALASIAAAAVVALLLFAAFGPQGRELEVRMGGSSRVPPAVWRWVMLRGVASALRPMLAGRGRARESPVGVRVSLLGVAVDEALVRGLDALRAGRDARAAMADGEDAGGPDAAPAARTGRAEPPLPLLYWHVWSNPAVLWTLTHRLVPFSALGSVHMSSRVTQAASRLPRRGLFDVDVRVTGEEPHRRGTVLVVRCAVRWRESRADDSASLLWESENRMLFFHAGGSKGASKVAGTETEAADDDVTEERHTLSLRASTGREFADLTGDYNPIHVSPAAARVFGFRAAVAHGMCVADRALPGLLRDLGAKEGFCEAGALPSAGELDVSFRRPLFLPSSPRVCSREDAPAGRSFAVRNDKGRACQIGTLRLSR